MIVIGHYTFPYFTMFYIIAFIACFVVLIVEGRMRNFPVLPWLLVIATGFIFFVLGCRIFAYSIEDWKTVLTYQSPEHATGLVMLGGLLLSVPAILAAKRFVNLNASSLDAYAFVLPVGMCIQRLGCLMAGCCYGTVTHSVGIQYGIDTPAFYEHSLQAIIPANAIHSLPVHAVQLYESIGCLIAVAFLLWFRKNLKSVGSLFYASGLSYYVVRFITEFFRSPNAHANTVKPWLQLNSIQWLMLCLIASSVIILVFKERKPGNISKNEHTGVEARMVLYFLLLVVLSFFASKLIGPAEIVVVCLVLFTTGGYLLVEVFKLLTLPKLRLTTSCLLFGSLIMMSQTYPEYAESDSTIISYSTISVGGLWGSRHVSNSGYDGCSGKSDGVSSNFQTQYQIGGLAFSRTTQKKEAKSFTWGASAFYGKFEEDAYYRRGQYPWITEISSSITESTYGISPRVQWDYKYAGIGIGLHFGNFLRQIRPPGDEYISSVSSVDNTHFYPEAYLRIGRMDRFFGEMSLARHFPSSFPNLLFQAGIGFSVRKDHLNRAVFRVGTSTATALFLSSAFPVGEHFVIEPYFGYFVPLLTSYDRAAPYDPQGIESDNAAVGSIALHYKFAKKPGKPIKSRTK